MIDIHSHILFGVDDGPSTLEQSATMVLEAEKAGIRTIVATPHYHEPLFETERLTDSCQELLYRVRNIDVTIKLGYEVFMNPFGQGNERIITGLTLDNSRYLLIELPFNASPGDGLEIIYSLRRKDVTPILAHPERNRNFVRDIKGIAAYIGAGCMIQADAASVVGIYGKDSKELVRKLIKRKQVDFIASNAHCAEDYALWYRKAFRTVAGWAGEEQAGRLFHYNAQGILNQIKEMHAV